MAKQQMQELPLLTLENAEYIYTTNFEGRIEGFNKNGDREFNVKLDPNDAEILKRDGWNVKYSKPGKNATPEVIAEFVPEPFLPVQVGFKFRPPTIIMIRDNKPTPVTEGTVSLLDSTEFTNIDMVIRARWWENESGSGYKAWLKSFYGTVDMDDLDRKYAYLQPSGSAGDPDDSPSFSQDD